MAEFTTMYSLFSTEAYLNLSSNATTVTAPPAPACWPVIIDPTTEELLDAVGSHPKFLAIIGSAIALTVFTVGIYLETLWFLCRKIPSRRKVQLSFVMGIYPVFSMCSLLGMFVPRASTITSFTAHVYFSMALVQFIMLMTGYYGDKTDMLHKLEGQIIQLATPPLSMFCFCCLPKIPVNKFTLPKFIAAIRLLVLQVAIIKPLFYFLGAVLWLNGSFIPGDFSASGVYLWFNMVYIVSTLFALNAIIIFYRLSMEPLREYHLTPKFLTVQLTLIITNVQSLTIGLCAVKGHIACKPPFHPGMRALYMDSMLNIVEMFIFNIIATACFRRMKGNMGSDQYQQRRQYSRLSQNSFRQDPARQIAAGDENDNKFPEPGSDIAKEGVDGGGDSQQQNGGLGTGAKARTHIPPVSDVWLHYGAGGERNDQDAPFLHVVAAQPNGAVTSEAYPPRRQSPASSDMGPGEDVRSTSGSILLSGSDRETNV